MSTQTFTERRKGERRQTPVHDEHYDRWRADHLRELDEEYRRWREGGSKNFPADFEAWRLARQQAVAEENLPEGDKFFERS